MHDSQIIMTANSRQIRKVPLLGSHCFPLRNMALPVTKKWTPFLFPDPKILSSYSKIFGPPGTKSLKYLDPP